jgi:hypothetical protein
MSELKTSVLLKHVLWRAYLGHLDFGIHLKYEL